MAVATRGSSAYDYRVYEPEEDIYEAPQQKFRPTRASRRALAARRAVFFMALIVIATVCIGLLLVKSHVAMEQRNINTLQQQIADKQRVNSELRANLVKKTDLNAIMQRADELGLSSPNGDQMVFVNLSRPTVITMSRSN